MKQPRLVKKTAEEENCAWKQVHVTLAFIMQADKQLRM